MRPIVPSLWRAGVGRLDLAWNSIPANSSPNPYIAHFPGIAVELRHAALSRLASGQ
jgi:hypothetical protein